MSEWILFHQHVAAVGVVILPAALPPDPL
eukprot:COSAG01_NODE_45889_length_405_cov_0.937908_1_plen_28_part_01